MYWYVHIHNISGFFSLLKYTGGAACCVCCKISSVCFSENRSSSCFLHTYIIVRRGGMLLLTRASGASVGRGVVVSFILFVGCQPDHGALHRSGVRPPTSQIHCFSLV